MGAVTEESYFQVVRAACGCVAFIMVDDAWTWEHCGKDLAKSAAQFGPPTRVDRAGYEAIPLKCPAHPNAGIREVTGKWKPPKVPVFGEGFGL